MKLFVRILAFGRVVLLLSALIISNFFSATSQNNKKLTPIMGWSSWNNYRVGISEGVIKKQADAMVTSGMKDAGYEYINIDDGFFGGRDTNGNILAHKTRFPNGMKHLCEYVHSKGLKAGIYSDAGINTCGSIYDKDTIGAGMGLFGHEDQDLSLLLNEWGYDFIKVDWCGGEKLKLQEQSLYTRISNLIKKYKPQAVYNVCRWQFPGDWVTTIADSWRISGDIRDSFESILKIIDLNADLWKYAGPGHVNDMDMLQVGRGMSFEEDKTHFSMWCMMASPLLAGNDLTSMSKETISILTNKELIAIDQDPLVYQARKIKDMGDLEIWARPLQSTMSGKIAVALLNRSERQSSINLDISSLGLNIAKGYTIHDIWNKTTSPKEKKEMQSFKVGAHGIVVLVVSGTSFPYNIFQIG